MITPMNNLFPWSWFVLNELNGSNQPPHGDIMAYDNSDLMTYGDGDIMLYSV